MIAVAAQVPDEPLIRWDWLGSHVDELLQRTGQHALLTAIAFFAGLVIASALAAISRRWRWTSTPITTLTTVLYTIPSVALFAALIPWLGTGLSVPAVALTTYSLVVLTPFLIVAFDEVDRATLDAADAMGMTRRQRLVLVELPLALPSIVAGLRVTAVTIIGLVTVGGLFGLGGFGNLIDDGLTRDFPTLIVVGVVASIALALVVDALLVGVGALVSPWQRSVRKATT
ncbi:MAG: ABC transporter permease [Acidimicrobiales bacterium]